MMYYTAEARKNAIADIRRTISKILEVPHGHLDYISSTKATQYLNDLIRVIDKEDIESQGKDKTNRKNHRLTQIYAAAVDMVDGITPIPSTIDMFEIMRDAGEYSISEICYVVDKLYADGFIRK